MVKIAHVTTIDASLYHLLLDQLISLQGEGCTVVGVSSSGPYHEKLRDAGIRHIPVLMTRKIFTPFRDLLTLVRLVDVFVREDFSIVHTHTPKAGVLGRLAAYFARVPVIVHTIHGFHFHERTPWIQKKLFIFLEKAAARPTDLILSQNKEDMDIAVRTGICGPEKIEFLGNGINLNRFDPQRFTSKDVDALRKSLGYSDDERVIGYVGRLEGRRKGLWDLLTAAKIVKDHMGQVQLLVVGSLERAEKDVVGPAQVEKIGIADICTFTGDVPNQELPLYYAMMDVLVLPSLYEGLPRVVMEATAMGTPAIVSDVKGNREAVRHGTNGLLVPHGDRQALAAAIYKLLENDSLRKELAASCRDFAEEHFDQQAVFERLKRSYDALLGTPDLR